MMPPKPSHALQEHVSRRQIGDNEIQVNVHALLHYLSCNEDRPAATAGTLLAQPFQPMLFQLLPSEKWKATVKQGHLDSILAHTCHDRATGSLCFSHRIPKVE